MLQKIMYVLWSVSLLSGCLPIKSRAEEHLAYYSDYFSFIGRDGSGYIAFALDNNRGVDGRDYQAERPASDHPRLLRHTLL